MEGLTDFEAPSRRLPEGREQPWRESSEPAVQLRMASRTPARPRLERKLAAVVAADVVGYSLLMGRDEEGALRRLLEFHAAIEPIVEADGGRIVNTAGDAMLLEFSSGVAALKCALAIQEVVSLLNRGLSDADKMLLRIGVNLGDVIVKGGDLFGEVVNVASRLEAIAEPGGICVSQSCYLQTRRQFDVDFIDLGEQRLKEYCGANSRLRCSPAAPSRSFSFGRGGRLSVRARAALRGAGPDRRTAEARPGGPRRRGGRADR